MEKQHDATKREMIESISSLRADAKTELLDTKVCVRGAVPLLTHAQFDKQLLSVTRGEKQCFLGHVKYFHWCFVYLFSRQITQAI